MANFGAKILNNAVGALAAQQAVIANISNNIANVNTPGYTRRQVELETNYGRGGGNAGLNIGNGVRIGGLTRISDEFIERLLRGSLGERGSANIQDEFLSRVEGLFNLTGERQTIGSTLSAFFTSVNDLAANPASTELRANTLQRAQDLVNSIRETFNSVGRLQREADDRLGTEIQTVNSLTGQIASLNDQIRAIESNGETQALDERDARNKLMNDLSEKISFSTIELADGTVTLSLQNGLTLVNGAQSRNLETTQAPSFGTGSLPPSLDGGLLSYVVVDFDPSAAGQAHVDLTQTLQGGAGSVAGLLQLRGYNDPANTTAFEGNGVLVEVASRVEALTRSLLTNFNTTYLGPDRDGSTAYHDPSSGDLNGNVPTQPFGFFDFVFAGAKDRGVADGLPTTADLDDIANTTITRNFSSILTLAVTTPEGIAAARDVSGGPPNPAQFPQGDNQNLLALAALRNTPQALSAGNFSLTATWDQAYNESVTFVGNERSTVDVTASVARANVASAEERRDSVSAVSLDEEFTNLMSFQKAYQASARMIRVADEMLDQILQLI